MAIVFCKLSASDNKSFYFEDTAAPACARCGLVTDLEWINPHFELKKKVFDLSFTYDLAAIASERFAQFASQRPGARFLPLPHLDAFYLMIVDPILRVDVVGAGVQFIRPCELCGRYTQIAGVTPPPMSGEQVPMGFSRTDTVFGSARDHPDRKTSQHPLFLVDPEFGGLLEAERFSGLLVRPIEDR